MEGTIVTGPKNVCTVNKVLALVVAIIVLKEERAHCILLAHSVRARRGQAAQHPPVLRVSPWPQLSTPQRRLGGSRRDAMDRNCSHMLGVASAPLCISCRSCRKAAAAASGCFFSPCALVRFKSCRKAFGYHGYWWTVGTVNWDDGHLSCTPTFADRGPKCMHCPYFCRW